MEDYERRARHAEELLKTLSERVNHLESQLAKSGSSTTTTATTTQTTTAPATKEHKTEQPKKESGHAAATTTPKEKPEKKKKEESKEKGGKKEEEKGKGSELLGIQYKKEIRNFSNWYTEVIVKAEMIDYYDISGCYILRPWSYQIWETIRDFLDAEFKKTGVQNSYFPLFVSERALTTEKDHVEGFAPEVAWVTRAGKGVLNPPIAVRPTSETIMYPAYSKWIRSHRDLPLKLNQWANVVRWEFKSATPFLRSREFLWQEGHTAFASKAEADKEVMQILEIYARCYEEVLAVPVIKGIKTENEKFPGGDYTTTVEAFIPVTGRGVQGATSHGLGQNFAKMFNIEFENTDGKRAHVWQNSWGFTTRSIGVMTMVHSDDKGLVLPPKIAPYQFVIVPIFSKDEAANKTLDTKANEIVSTFQKLGFRGFFDASNTHNPGFKYNHWEMKGVPVRLELGPKDLANNSIVAVRRDTAAKVSLPLADLQKSLPALLDEIQKSIFQRAKSYRDDHVKRAASFEEFMTHLNDRNIVLVPFCDEGSCEDTVKDKSGNWAQDAEAIREREEYERKKAEGELPEVLPLTGAAKSLCKPFAQGSVAGQKCFHCGKPAKTEVLFGRSY